MKVMDYGRGKAIKSADELLSQEKFYFDIFLHDKSDLENFSALDIKKGLEKGLFYSVVEEYSVEFFAMIDELTKKYKEHCDCTDCGECPYSVSNYICYIVFFASEVLKSDLVESVREKNKQ